MANQVKRVVTKDQDLVEPASTVVNARSESVQTYADPKLTLANLVWYLYGLVAVILGLRFVLKLAAANQANAFVKFIYNVSGVLSAPFDTIFGVAKTKAGSVTSVFEPSILVAIAVYALIAWGIVRILTLNEVNNNVV